jgi:CHAT domain-containing protein
MTEEGDIIWFVPHNFLHYLPLHALKVEGRYLIERNPICYTPSASVMKYCHAKRKNKREKALVLGDSRSDLAHACEEASIVADLFDTTPYLQERATKSLIKQKLEQEGESLDILHFCCHGRFRQDDALKSCIVLAQEGEGDEEWNLTAEEILQLQMQAELVTLSACETGINENRPGDELIGLTRALIYAGTPSVIVSLWAVDDLSSGLLMEHFYQKFCQPIEENNQLITKAEALQAASLYIKNMKVQEVIDYYKFRLGRLDRVRDKKLGIKFQISLANMEIYAGNPQAAIEIYQSILDQLSEEVERASELAKQIKNKLPSLKLKARLLKQKENSTIDYAIQPFNRLFYWASFVLVGDWK